jgi:pre-mRNA-splicing factor CWC26
VMMASKLSYLQKYLDDGQQLPGGDGQAKGKDKKKKKKKSKGGKANEDFLAKYRCRIIDEDDVFAARAGHKEEDQHESDEDKYETQEERPQVAGVVDDRPEIEIMRERFTTSTFKAVVKVESDSEDEASTAKRRRRHDSSDEDDRGGRETFQDQPEAERQRRKRHDSDDDDDASPPRVRVKEEPLSDEEDFSPARRTQLADSRVQVKKEPLSDDSDLSPRRSGKSSRRRRHSTDSDVSPPRRIKGEDSDQDLSPPRKVARGGQAKVKVEVDSDGDISPPRAGRTSSATMSKTLDGKKAGLQNAQALKKELDNLKHINDKKFNKVRGKVFFKSSECLPTCGFALSRSAPM